MYGLDLLHGRRGNTDDGLGFTELAFRESKLSPFQWFHHSVLSDAFFARYTNQKGRGSESLANTALRAVMRHRRFLDGEELKHIAWDPFGRRLWESMVSMKAVSIAVWRCFAIAYGSDPEARSIIGDLTAPCILPYDMFSESLDLIKCKSVPFEYLTVIEFRSSFMGLEDWLTFCSLKNLLILHVFTTSSEGLGLNGRAARCLREHAEQSGALPMLRELILTGVGDLPNAESLDDLAAIPRLNSIQFRGGLTKNITADDHSRNWTYTGNQTGSGNLYPIASESHLFGRSGQSTIKRLLKLGEAIASSYPDDPSLSVPRLGIVVGSDEVEGERMRRIPTGVLLKRCRILKRKEEDLEEETESKKPNERGPKLRKRKQQNFGDLFSGMQGES